MSRREASDTGKTHVQQNGTFDPQDDRPDTDAGAVIVTFAIACCGLALALVVAVVYTGL
jgi:hypothetical protein